MLSYTYADFRNASTLLRKLQRDFANSILLQCLQLLCPCYAVLLGASTTFKKWRILGWADALIVLRSSNFASARQQA